MRKLFVNTSIALRQYISKHCLHNSPKIVENPSLKMDLPQRLSVYNRPVNYKLKLHPDMKTGKYSGTVDISVNVNEEKSHISLHTHLLDIGEVKVTNKEGNEIPVKYLEVKQLEQLVLQFEKALTAGSYNIKLDFKGHLRDRLVGFYLSQYGKDSKMVASKFEPTYARQAFPCFDEPDFKATYDITLVKPPGSVALSNMNDVTTVTDANSENELVTFATSVPMSTYLACFVICEDFSFKQAEVNANGIGKNFVLRTFAQKDQLHKIDFSLDIGKRATEFYIKYYEVPFPLPKLDMIAIPDYISGATEHWGLITYRETSFLVDSAKASSKNKINVANVVAHELAHMWFGNLVTMKWWDDLWLNEGFASYMQLKALNAVQPSWRILDQFLTRTMHNVLTTDAKLSSHPIVQTVITPDQITAIFDVISYSKGASVLRMLEGFIGEESFRRGVSDYLKKYAYGNTITHDLLTSLEPYFKRDNPGLDLTHILDTWTRQMGYPLLTVVKGSEPNTFVITQRRFLLQHDAVYPNDSPFNYRWYVPITFKTNKDLDEKIVWFADNVDSVKITLTKDETWLKLNHNQVGYYRVTYPLDMWNALTEELINKSDKLTVSDRAHLLNEVFALAQAHVVPYEVALNLSSYLQVEEDYVPWETATSVFALLKQNLSHSLALDYLLKYVQQLIESLYNKQKWEKTPVDVIQGLIRTTVLSLATTYQLPNAVSTARALFLRWLEGHGGPMAFEIEPELRDFVYYSAMKTATPSEWEKLWQIYLKEDDVQELTKLRTALTAPRNTEILTKYLLLSWGENNVRGQDYLTVLQQIARNPAGTALVWDYVREHWTDLAKRYTLNSRYLGHVIPAITGGFNTEVKLKEMETFFAQYPEAGAGESDRKVALENVRNNIRWAQTYQEPVTEWLKKRVGQ